MPVASPAPIKLAIFEFELEDTSAAASEIPSDASELANATGLTSGSVTALIDRLAKAGYVERCDDPSDRRKVLVRIRHDAIEPIKSLYMGIQKKMSWHTFRHTFSSILKGNGEDVKVVQELLRHSTSRMTLDTYTQALSPQKRAAQSKVVGMIRSKPSCTVVVPQVSGEILVTH